MQDRIDRLDAQKPGLLALQAINAVLHLPEKGSLIGPMGGLAIGRSAGTPRAGGDRLRYKNTIKELDGGFCGNELILEFPTKSMPSGLRAAAILGSLGDRA